MLIPWWGMGCKVQYCDITTPCCDHLPFISLNAADVEGRSCSTADMVLLGPGTGMGIILMWSLSPNNS